MSAKGDLINDLRALADFLEVTEFPDESRVTGSVTAYAFCSDATVFSATVRTIGSCEKDVLFNSYAVAVKKFGEARLQITIDRDLVCTRRKVGEKTIEAKPERVLPAEEQRVEDVYEWDCPESFLGMGRT